MMLTIEDLKDKLMWEDTDDILTLLDLSTAEMLDYLNDAIESKQDKLRDYYDEGAEELGGEEESNEPD